MLFSDVEALVAPEDGTLTNPYVYTLKEASIGLGGTPEGGLGAPGWQIPGTRAFWAVQRRNLPLSANVLLPCSALPCPALPPAALVPFERPLQGARCGLFDGNPCFSSSGRHRPRGPTTNSERKQRARKHPLRGVWGVNPKP